ncbi:DUF2254 family protein [Pontibacter korlensis]
MGLVFGLICLILFVYFIHTISKAIQVDFIMNSVFHKAAAALELEERVVGNTHAPFNTNGDAFKYILKNDGNGYLEQVNLSERQQLARQYKMQLEILVEVGSFTVEGTPLMKLTKAIDSEDGLMEKLQQCFVLRQEEVVMKDYEQGVKQISEIAVKALSPGINDPGTALKAIDFLTLLFIRRMKCDERNCLLDEQEQVLVIDKIILLEELLHRYLSSIRSYGKADLQVNLRLLRCLHSLLNQEPPENKTCMIRKHAFAVISDADKAILNSVDRERLNCNIVGINSLLPAEQWLTELKI